MNISQVLMTTFKRQSGDESLVYGYDIKTKAQSSQWKRPENSRSKKARLVRSNVKILFTVFFDCNDVVHHGFLLQGRTINEEYYLAPILRSDLSETHRIMRNQSWILQNDNAPAHTSMLVRQFLAKNKIVIIPQPPYSRVLAPADFYLFPKLKTPRKGNCFATIEKIKEKSKQELLAIPRASFRSVSRIGKNSGISVLYSYLRGLL